MSRRIERQVEARADADLEHAAARFGHQLLAQRREPLAAHARSRSGGAAIRRCVEAQLAASSVAPGRSPSSLGFGALGYRVRPREAGPQTVAGGPMVELFGRSARGPSSPSVPGRSRRSRASSCSSSPTVPSAACGCSSSAPAPASPSGSRSNAASICSRPSIAASRSAGARRPGRATRPRLARGEPRLGLPALVHRPARDLRPRSCARARDLQRRAATSIRASTETDYPLHGRISQIPARLIGYGERWDGEALHALRRGRGRADGGVRREPGADPADRGGARRPRDQRRRPGREPRLPADPAHAALPLQLRLSAARRGRRAAGAEPRGSCTPCTICAARAPATASRGRRPTSASRSTSTTWSARTAWRRRC